MVIGFMGKGGSGKTTMSTRFSRYIHGRGYAVLAIDADHNMDLLFNLSVDGSDGMPFLGSAGEAFASAVGLSPGETYQRRLVRGSLPTFFLRDAFTRAYSREVVPGLMVMAAGPQTDDVRHGAVCSHVLAAPLKLYLPCLSLGEGEAAIVDSTAGMDMVGSGIAAGMDLVFICSEPTVHGTKTAKQIAGGLEWYGVPYAFVLTKVAGEEDRARAEAWLGSPARFAVPANDASDAVLEAMRVEAESVARASATSTRMVRAVENARKGVDYWDAKT